MNRLLKYVLIVNLIFLLCGSLAVIFKLLDDNYVKNNPPAPLYDSEGKQLVQERPRDGAYYTFFMIFIVLTGLSFVIAIILSAYYFYHNHGFKGFFSSLIIPISLLVISLLFDYVRNLFDPCSGEECMYGIFLFIYLIAFLLCSIFINLIVAGVIYFRNKK